MKWFKHMANASSEGEFIAELEDEFGLEGYARYFKLLEAVALKMDETDNCSASYPWSKWQTILKGKRNKLETFLEHLENKRQINLKRNGNILEIEMPKLLELRDEYSRKIRSESGATPAQDIDKEIRKKKDLPPTPKGEISTEPKPEENKFPKSPAGELVSYLYDNLSKRGVTDTFLNRAWIQVGVNEANKLLDTEKPEEIRAAIDWFLVDEFWSGALNRFSHIRKHWDKYQLSKSQPRNSGRASPARNYGMNIPCNTRPEGARLPEMSGNILF